MHPNPVYRQTAQDENIAFARSQSFGVLCLSDKNAPMIAHVPFLIAPDGATAELHLVRSNPIVRALAKGPQPATIIVNGPHGYVSPDWYGIEDQVPTWNYVAVHLTGQVEVLPQDALGGILDRLSHHFEAQLAPKKIWTSDKMADGVMDRMMRQIVPVQFTITDVNGTWKLNQNKADEVRLRAADHMEESPVGVDTATLAEHMRKP